MRDTSEKWMAQVELVVGLWKRYREFKYRWGWEFSNYWRDGIARRYNKLPRRYKLLADVRIERYEQCLH